MPSMQRCGNVPRALGVLVRCRATLSRTQGLILRETNIVKAETPLGVRFCVPGLRFRPFLQVGGQVPTIAYDYSGWVSIDSVGLQ